MYIHWKNLSTEGAHNSFENTNKEPGGDGTPSHIHTFTEALHRRATESMHKYTQKTQSNERQGTLLFHKTQEPHRRTHACQIRFRKRGLWKHLIKKEKRARSARRFFYRPMGNAKACLSKWEEAQQMTGAHLYQRETCTENKKYINR